MRNYNVNLTRFVLADLLDNPDAERAILSLRGFRASSVLSLGDLIHRIIEDGKLVVDVDHVLTTATAGSDVPKSPDSKRKTLRSPAH